MKKGAGGLRVPAEGGLAVGTASECPLRALGTRALAPGLVLFVQWMGLWGCEVSPQGPILGMSIPLTHLLCRNTAPT